ncbi:GNAT family N-acetyltransferase [Enterococcus sp. 669A]|uniref:GNAT family N-acetyltransferase n=1 Tax=Candidatus Enterococcus moelleringii TaxID=2815325 RepID=A0ABS3LD25_9ENTE|nr:GNAT family N-acetyltransferase [Enterococcus sp. 669A]MBO1306631.1 GNAT family N-acetyltransferase [Enterococcus sp. 669A]
MKATIREMTPAEYPLLEEFLYQAIFQQDSEHVIPRAEIKNPELNVYIKDFGRLPDDHCLCAEVDKQVVGAVWVRILDGFGSVDQKTPEFAISLLPEFRGQGIGTELMKAMLAQLKQAGYTQTSLAVQKDNYALEMYEKLGFEIVAEDEEEYIMVCQLN